MPGKQSTVTYRPTLTVSLVSQVKSQQAEVMRILESKSIKYELIDISVGGAVRDEMRSKSGNPTAIPPQIFNEDQYCGVRRTDSRGFWFELKTLKQYLPKKMEIHPHVITVPHD